MKSVVTFVLGAVLAGGVAYFAMRKPADPGPASAPAAVAIPPAAPTEALAPERAIPPEPMQQTQRSSSSKRTASFGRADSSLRPSTSPLVNKASAVPQTTPIAVPAAAPPPAVAVAPPRMEERQPEPPPRIPRTVTLATGTMISVRLDQTISTEHNQSGDSFRALLDQPLSVDGVVVAERGSRVTGRIIDSDRAGRVKGVALLTLELTQISTSDGQKVKIQTETFNKHGETSRKADGVKIGAAAAIGAAIGALAGGGKGAAIGAGAGGAAGTGGVMATRGKDAELPVETKLSFRLRNAVNLTERLP